jgi:hypothetical protein
VAALREEWPELADQEARAEVVNAISYASVYHSTWLWSGVGEPRE